MAARSSSTIVSCPHSEMYKSPPDNANPVGPEREAESAGTLLEPSGTVPVLPGPAPAIVLSTFVKRSRDLTALFIQSAMYSVLDLPRITSAG